MMLFRLCQTLLNRRTGSRAAVRPVSRPRTPEVRPALEQLETRLVPSATSPNQRFINQLYQVLLGRPAEDSALAAASSLDSGKTTHSKLALSVVNTIEHRVIQVQGLYKTILHRAGDSKGVNDFVTLLLKGGTIAQVKQIMASSAEYFQTQGGGNADGFLKAIYRDGLGRTIDSSGQATFGKMLADGDRGKVVAAIFGSIEGLQQKVQGHFNKVLKRAAEPSALNNLANALKSGLTEEQLIAALAGSGEFLSKA